MVTVPIFLCLYNGNSSITTYSVKHQFSLADATRHLKNCYIAGIRDKRKILLASIIIITDAESSKEQDMIDTIKNSFENYKQTKKLMKHAISCPISKIEINSKIGTLESAMLSEKELEIICHEFYIKNSISGTA